MEYKDKAAVEVHEREFVPKLARKRFLKVYVFFLYHDTRSLLQILDYRKQLDLKSKLPEKRRLFQYMLRLLKQKHPHRVASLCSA